MGMFDVPRPISEVIPENTTFILHDVNMGAVVTSTEFGDAQLVEFTVESMKARGRTTILTGIGRYYEVLAKQKNPAELPMEVKLVKGKPSNPKKSPPKLVVPAHYVETEPGVWEGAQGMGQASATADDDIPF